MFKVKRNPYIFRRDIQLRKLLKTFIMSMSTECHTISRKSVLHPLNPPPHGGGGSTVRPLLKKSSGNPYLNILDFSQPFFSDARMKKKSQKIVIPPIRTLLG